GLRGDLRQQGPASTAAPDGPLSVNPLRRSAPAHALGLRRDPRTDVGPIQERGAFCRAVTAYLPPPLQHKSRRPVALVFSHSQADFLVSAHFAPSCCPTTTINS